MAWYQQILNLPEFSRGFHLITERVPRNIPELTRIKVGLLHLYIMHTSASLAINENADRDVRNDLESSLNHIVPESFPYEHTVEGPDDMPAHIKAALIGSSLSIPVQRGQLLLGTWQGIYLCEHRNHGGQRKIVATLHGEE